MYEVDRMQQTLKVTIDGMHCGACIRRVTTALQSIPGVQINAVEIGSADVSFNPADLSPAQITAAIDRIGFTTRSAQ